jgi:hypothetical protein
VVERAWRAVSSVYKDWDEAMRRSKNNMLWVPMRKLMIKARQKREKDVAAIEIAGRKMVNPEQTRQYGDIPSDFGDITSLASEEAALDPVRPLQQGITMSGDVLAQSLNNPMSQFYNQQFADHNTASQLSMQYQQVAGNAGSAGGVNGNMAFSSNTSPWLDIGLDDPSLGLEMDLSGENGGVEVSWDNFDDLVRDFQMEVDNRAPEARGPALGGMGSWW